MVKQKKAPLTIIRFKVGNRTYELVDFFQDDESSVPVDTVVKYAQELNANLGEKDGEFILKHQDELPEEFQCEFYLIFAAWRHPSLPRIASLRWNGRRWYRSWGWPGTGWWEDDWLVRRVK